MGMAAHPQGVHESLRNPRLFQPPAYDKGRFLFNPAWICKKDLLKNRAVWRKKKEEKENRE